MTTQSSAATPATPESAVSSSKARPASAEELADALRRIREAARKSGAPTYAARIESLEKLEKALISKKSAIAAAAARDFGNRSKHETLVADVFVVLGAIKHAKTHLRDWMETEERETAWMFLPAASQIVYQPLGVVGIISPWNYPVQLALSPLVSALAAGNRAMIKPSELVPETGEVLRDLIAEAFPADFVTVVTGGPEVGEAFSKLPFDHLVFTGSTRVGKIVMRAASENLVPVTLELGGKSPTIVGSDYGSRVAAETIMAGKTFNAGQTCIAPDYVLLPAGTRDAFVEGCKTAVAKMYPTLEKNADYTTIINDGHYTRLQSYVQDAKTRGGRVVEINPANETLDAASRKMAPTLVLDPTDEMMCMQEEIFGPVLPVKTYDKIDDAIAYVNDHPRPLALYCFSNHRETVDRVLGETISGGVSVNATLLHCVQDDMPFGGVGASGMGHYHAREGFEAFSKKKPVFRQARINASGLMRPPYGKTIDRMLRFLMGK
jgi:coniferyl-aldehyde dehydrogenase